MHIPHSPHCTLPPPLHHTHTQGMPEAWAKLLQNSGISQAEKKKNPQNVIKALEFFTTTRSGTGEGETKFLTAQRMGKLLRCQRNQVLYERKGWRKRGSYT